MNVQAFLGIATGLYLAITALCLRYCGWRRALNWPVWTVRFLSRRNYS